MGKSSISICLVSALFTLCVLWKPALAEDKCSVGCKGSDANPTFVSGNKYNYAVEGTVSVYLSGADKQETSVKLLGQVSVSALGNCAHVLKVQNLVISGPTGKKYEKPTGLDKPVRFVLQGGLTNAEICAEEGDTRRSLNIKRAIISLLQTRQTSSSEVDIFGICPTEASASKEGGAVLLHRSRDLSRCAHREHGKNDLISTVYDPQAEIRSAQILQSTLNVESKLNNGVPEKVSAIEEHLYKPFSVGDNGARAKVMTKLTFTGKAAGADNGNFKEVRSIIFENPHGEKLDQSKLASALAVVKDTAKTLTNEASSQSAGNFAQLVRILRTTNKDDLVKVFNQVKGNSLERRVFLDGLLRAGTSSSIEVSIKLLKNKDLSDLEEKLVFLSLANARHIDDEAVKTVASLLDIPNVPKNVYIGVGALAGAFCRSHDCHHVHSQGIAAVSQKFAAKLGNCKPANKLDEDNIVAVLKGIRNIKHLEDNIIDKLVHCANDNGVKARVRAAALEAFQADPCTSKLKNAALNLMKNRQLDSEIRIKAYLSVIACPCAKSANEIKTLLDTEPVHQVGRFITSSLRHIKASTNPDKKLAKQHYGLIGTPNKFNIDDRKYSFYREASFNVDALGLGGNIEQTVIYSQDSFVPRSASLNLTAEVFGQNLNVFEIGGRQGNLDRVIEHFLGPRSFLRTQNPQDLYENLLKRFSDTENTINKQLNVRSRRSVKAEIDSFDKRVKGEVAPYDNELDLDIYVKLFGADALFLSLGDDKGFDFNRVLDQLLKHLNAGINKAKKFQEEIRAHVLFMDSELAYATSTGLPLKLNLVGSATGRFEVSTNTDLRQLFKDPANAKIDFKLVPSTDIEVSGYFLVDAYAVSTGLKVVTNLHSSTGGHLIAKTLENGQGFELNFGLPIDKQEVITASNDLVYFTTEKGEKEKETALKIDTDRQEYAECFDQLTSVLGLTFCGELSVPFTVSGPDAQASVQKFLARYPLTGASKLKVRLEKNDLRGYRIKGVFKRDQPNKKSFELLFEAEGSKNRKTSLSGELVNAPEEKSVTLALESPIKVISGHASFVAKSNEVALVVKAMLDSDEYFGRAGFNVQGNSQRKVYTPVLEYQMPSTSGKKSLDIDGQVIREQKGSLIKYNAEGIKIKMNNEVINVNGNVGMDNGAFESEIKAIKGDHNMHLTVSLKGHAGKIEFQNTLNPMVNFKLDGHSEFQKGNIRNDLELYYGGDLKNQQNSVKFNQLLKYHQNSAQDFGLITKNKFAINTLPLVLEFNAEADPKKVDVKLDGQYFDKKADFDFEARTHIKTAGDYQVKVVANLDKRGFQAFSKRDIVNADKSNCQNYIVINGIGKYELSGVVLHKTKPNDVNVGVNGQLKISGSGRNEEIHFDVGLIETAKEYSSHAKISRSNVEFLVYLVKIQRGSNPSGTLSAKLKDTVSANGNYKVTDADGKGNGMLIIDFPKSARKIKADAKFLAKEPVFNADVDLFLNFEKDNKDKIHFSTQSKNANNHFSSKNVFDYAGKKYELNLNKEGDNVFAGKKSGLIEVVLPTGRCLSFKVNRDLVSKENNVNGQAEFVLSDEVQRGGAASTITYKSKLATTEGVEKMDYQGQLLIKLKDGKNLQNNFYVKDFAEGDHHKFDFKTEVTGDLIPKPASLSATLEYSDPTVSIIDGFEKYHLKGNYGSDIGFEAVGDSDAKLMEKGEKKYREDNTITIRLPLENVHDIKIVSNILFVLPQNKDLGVEYSLVNSLQVNSDLYKVDASGKFGETEGFGKVKVLVPHVDPLSVDLNYKAHLTGEKKTGNVEIKSTYGKGKTATLTVVSATQDREFSLLLKANAPQAEKLKKLEFNILSKRPTPDSYSNVLTVDVDGKVYKSELQAVYSKANPLMDIKFTNPNDGKTSRVLVRGSGLSSSQHKVDLKLENIKDYSLEASAEGSMQKDALVLRLVADSEKLGLKRYKVDISSKNAGSGKRLEFNAVNDGKNIASGSTSYISKQEGSKTIIEGSGSVKVREEQKSATFKYIRTLLTEGSEQGVETFMNVAIGERSYVAESRVTNMEYKNSYVYCEEKKQCAHAELNSKLQVKKPGSLLHTVNIGADLRKLGFKPEFGLEYSGEVSDRLPQYKLDLHMNKDDKKYHLHVYSTPEYGRFPNGITVTLPHRVLALESELTFPTNKALPFPIKAEVVLNLDKRKPQQKSALRMLVDVTGDDKQGGAVAEFGYSHPKLGKEASLKFRGHLQRPSDNNLKIESAVVVSHPNLGADREGKFLLEASPNRLKALIDTPIVKVIDVEANGIFKDNHQQGEVKFSLLQGKAVLVKAIAKDFKYFEFTTSYNEDAQRKLSIIAHLDPESKVDVSADIILPNEKKNIAHGALFLQDNLVKSDQGFSKPNFEYFVSALKQDLHTLVERIQQLGTKASKDFTTTLDKLKPSFVELEKAYSAELEALIKELTDDETLKEISHVFKEIAQFIGGIVETVTKATAPLVKGLQDAIQENSKKILEMYEQKIKPELVQAYENISKLVKEYFDAALDTVAHLTALVMDFFEKHKAELQELTSVITEFCKDLTRLAVSHLKEIRVSVVTFFQNICNQIKELPIIADLKERIKEFAVPDQLLNLLTQASQVISSFLPNEDCKQLVEQINSYVQKKLRQEKVNDVAELNAIYSKFTLALTSLLQLVRQQTYQFGTNYFSNFNAVPSVLPSVPSLPTMGILPGFSLINQLVRGDLPDPLALINAYRPRSLNPLDEVPSKLRAVVVNGQHIFTFDGRHLTFPGTCRYVLVHDFVDRNFTLTIQLQNGLPKALTLEDKSGTIMELKDNGQVTVNGAAHGFPVMEKESFAFREANGRMGFGTLYGLIARCTKKLEVCYFEVSGFYLGKLRGLLGDGNNEQYDDFRLPNGKIVNSEAEFGNAYRLASSCPPVTPPAHSHHQHHAPLPAACERVFGGLSPLRAISPLLDIAPFRQACIHAVANNQANADHEACDLGRGYVALAVTGLLPGMLPAHCVQCTDGDKPRNVGEVFEVKLPAKLADVIVYVETTKPNEKNFKELVVPLVSQVVDQLKAKKIDDIKVHLVGVTNRFPYPIIYDADNKLKNAKVQFLDESILPPTPILRTGKEAVDNAQTKVAHILDSLKDTLGISNVNAGYASFGELPLRAGSVKAVINAVGEAYENQIPKVKIFGSGLNVLAFHHTDATVAIIAPTPELKFNGHPVIGLDTEQASILGTKEQIKSSSICEGENADECIASIRRIMGTVYSSTNFFALDAPQQKQFLKVAATNVVERMVRRNFKRHCQCAFVDPFRVRSVCYNEPIKEVARRRK